MTSDKLDRDLLMRLEIDHIQGKNGKSVLSLKKELRTKTHVDSIRKRLEKLHEAGLANRYPMPTHLHPEVSSQWRWIYVHKEKT